MKNPARYRSIVAMLAACLLSAGVTRLEAQPRGGPRMMVKSTAFDDGGVVPEKYAARGENVQPDFTFSNVPENAVSIAVIFHDIDVALQNGTGDVLHWIAWNIPASAGSIPEGSLPSGSVEGSNIRQQPGYMGPGAPVGERYHHYVFEFYVLNENLSLPATAGRDELLEAMAGKVIDKAAYVGRYRGSN